MQFGFQALDVVVPAHLRTHSPWPPWRRHSFLINLHPAALLFYVRPWGPCPVSTLPLCPAASLRTFSPAASFRSPTPKFRPQPPTSHALRPSPQTAPYPNRATRLLPKFGFIPTKPGFSSICCLGVSFSQSCFFTAYHLTFPTKADADNHLSPLGGVAVPMSPVSRLTRSFPFPALSSYAFRPTVGSPRVLPCCITRALQLTSWTVPLPVVLPPRILYAPLPIFPRFTGLDAWQHHMPRSLLAYSLLRTFSSTFPLNETSPPCAFTANSTGNKIPLWGTLSLVFPTRQPSDPIFFVSPAVRLSVSSLILTF